MSTSTTSPPPPPSPPLPPAPIQDANLQFFLSGGTNNASPASSIGGGISKVNLGQITSGVNSNLFNTVTPAQASSGITQHRCFFVKNNSTGTTIRNAKIWFETLNTDPDVTISMGLDPFGKNTTPSTLTQDTNTPSGVTFSQPTSGDFNSLTLGRLNAGDYYPIWVKRVVAQNAQPFHNDSFVVRAEGASQPAAINVPDFAVAAVGSLSCSNVVAQQAINNIAARTTAIPPLQRFIALGDLAAANTPTCWFNMTSSIDTLTHVVLGNQELYTEITGATQPSLLNSYLAHYNLHSVYYSFNYGPVHFLVMNTEILYTVGSPQYNFVVNDLKSTTTNGNIFWIVVCCHQPMWNDSASGAPDGSFVPSSFASTYHPIFDPNPNNTGTVPNFAGVDLVLTGHSYNYQRTYPILYGTPNPSPTVTGTSSFTNPGAPVMVNVGTGGYRLDSTIPFVTPQPNWIAFTDNADFGYLLLNFTSTASLCTGTFYNAANVAVDSFTISKT